MKTRIHNFSAGPGVLPEPVLEQACQDLWSHGDYGIGIAECSHRGKQFDDVLQAAKQRIARLLTLDDDQVVLFLHGGARTQFYQLPMNFLRGGRRATYLDTGAWSAYAIADAKIYGTVDVPFSSKANRYDRVPEPGEWGELPEGTTYLHYTANNTIAGTEFHYVPEVPEGVWLASDMSSNFLSRPIDGSRFGFIYAGAQKNIGPSGTTVVIVRKSLLASAVTDGLPKMLQYAVQVEKDSMLNTPTTFSIYMIERVTAWLEENGGLEAMEKRNIAQAERLYRVIDASGFWKGMAQPGSRSRMNVTFTSGNPDLDAAFVKQANAAGLSGLKGHRSVGGLRASIYNAQTDAAVDALCDFLREFERTHG